MKRRFRGGTIVLRKKHVFLFPLIIGILFTAIKADIPANDFFSKMLFKSALLCMDSENDRNLSNYMNVLKSGSMVFAYNPSEEDVAFVTADTENISEPVTLPDTVLEDSVQERYLTIPSQGIEMKNQTSFSPDTQLLLQTENSFLPVEINSPKPQVLLFHTHTTESFNGYDRTDDETKNVVAVGAVIADILNERGINTLHCKTVHDYDYNGSYGKSYETVEKLLSENPSVKVVLDVHRDGITYEDGSGLRVISDINGQTVAQFMLVVGTDEGGLYHPGWQTNLSFALKIQNKMNEKYPGLARPLNLRSERFNQNLSAGMMIVECGGNGNSLSEVQYGAELFADALFDVISQ